MDENPGPDLPDTGGPGGEAASGALESFRRAAVADLTTLPTGVADALEQMRVDFEQFDLEYRSALSEVETRLEVLRDEYLHLHDHNPIEHIVTRVKSAQSILRKAAKRGLSFDLEVLRREITDIAGARVVLSFTEDVYQVFELFTGQPDIRLIQVKDYIAEPKPSGYRSLHVIVAVPVHFSTGTQEVTVEVQFRTIAMDFWASLEHKIHYKFDGDVPPEIAAELNEAATAAAAMDARMEHLHRQVRAHSAPE